MTHHTDNDEVRRVEQMREACAAHLHALLAHEQDMVVHALEVRPISTESLRDAMYRAGTCEGYRLAEAAIRALPLPAPSRDEAEPAPRDLSGDLGAMAKGIDEECCCLACGREVAPSPCCPDYPVWPGPCRSCYSDPTPAPSLPAAPAPTRPRVSTAGSGQEARLVVTPAAPSRPADDATPTREAMIAALTKIADHQVVVCDHYETCQHAACDFSYFAQELAALVLRGSTTEIAEAAITKASRPAERAQDAKGGE